MVKEEKTKEQLQNEVFDHALLPSVINGRIVCIEPDGDKGGWKVELLQIPDNSREPFSNDKIAELQAQYSLKR
jgi:hypothetical protein